MEPVVVASVPVPSHVAPLLPVARDLVRRGHPVSFLTGHRFEEAVRSTGAAFAPLPAHADYDPARLDQEFPERATLGGRDRLAFDMRTNLTNPVPAQHHALQELLGADEDAGEATVVVHENAFLGAWPLLLGAPGARPAGVVAVGVEPLSAPSEDTAPFGSGLPPDTSPPGRVRNRRAHERTRAFFARVQENLVRSLRAAGAVREPPFLLDGVVTLPDRYLQLSVEGLEYPRGDLPPHLSFVGAPEAPDTPDGGTGTGGGARADRGAEGGAPAGREGGLPHWWPDVRAAERVVAVAGAGELAGRTLRALAGLDALVVAAPGPGVRLTGVPGNARVAPSVPYGRLLPHTDVVVGNGGYAGVQSALRHGVPMVLGPQYEEEDEDAVEAAARAAWAGAAVDLGGPRPGGAEIRAAVETVLADPRYRKNAARLRDEYAAHDALGEIASAVEGFAPGP
ncbi:glycosyltransferase [Streptomyces fuscigenes]|uniref:glycosyltransferase n=1 Tax=Streptomyces fuscigenes TaxID=1528880 RepID=UPI001F1FDD44|nr:nucleotide disphospho-sugar-binding domain-containing protein [Streptomyces fuscigenes]MCF3964249.1 hypothetical protein [Streptomyces fuscigenes]